MRKTSCSDVVSVTICFEEFPYGACRDASLLLAMYLDECGLREINLARRANPDRSFTNFVYGQVTSAMKKSKSDAQRLRRDQ